MSDESTRHISFALYQYMCRNIVGSEEAVKTKRLLTTISDNLLEMKVDVNITSGSFGEGLEMKESDFDFMHVVRDFQEYENKSNIEFDRSKIFFRIKTNDTKLGFVKLQLLHSIYIDIFDLCVQDGDGLFISNNRFKSHFGSLYLRNRAEVRQVNHGPCLSDKHGVFDIAFCLHSRSWIGQAEKWLTRSRGPWPSNEVVSRIKEHGVLFVPIGVKGSPKEEIEWRISFSVGEKFLIFTFTHTQLLCYALLKIVLKDIISKDKLCKDILCSYYTKNIIFWVSEEIPPSEWKPNNLIHCFMQCFKRLIYCVEYALCPHFFIPENNMFENKIEGETRQILLDKLYLLHSFSWRCILFSPQLQYFAKFRYMSGESPEPFADYIERIVSSSVLIFSRVLFNANYSRAIKMILSHRSTTIQLYYRFCLSALCQSRAQQEVPIKTNELNKDVYNKYITCQSLLLQGLYRDAVSSWLILASLYYKMKNYNLALRILTHSLSKCIVEKIYWKSKLTSVQRRLLSSNIFQNKRLVHLLQVLHLERVHFYDNSTLIPRELELEVLNRIHIMPPVVFAYFLSFLCHYHQRDVRECRNSLAATVLEKIFCNDYL